MRKKKLYSISNIKLNILVFGSVLNMLSAISSLFNDLSLSILSGSFDRTF